jgi:hypothetical protein
MPTIPDIQQAGVLVSTPSMNKWTTGITELQATAPAWLAAPAAGAAVTIAAVGSINGVNQVSIPTSGRQQIVTVNWAVLATSGTATDGWRSQLRLNGVTNADSEFVYQIGINVTSAGSFSFIQPANTANGAVQTVVQKVSGTSTLSFPANDSRFCWLTVLIIPVL